MTTAVFASQPSGWRAWFAPGVVVPVILALLTIGGSSIGIIISMRDRLTVVETKQANAERILMRLEDKVDALVARP